MAGIPASTIVGRIWADQEGFVGISYDAANKQVFYDANDHHLIDSRVSRNPIIQADPGFDVVSVFRRVKVRSNSPDGNPLIYALKSANGYSIDRPSLRAFLPEFNGVMRKLAPAYPADLVVPIPSSAAVSAMFAKRVAKYLVRPRFRRRLGALF